MSSPTGTFVLSPEMKAALCEFAFNSPLEEVCGFILRGNIIHPIRNVHPYPRTGFSMDPEQVLLVDPNDVLAVWHSHPSGSLKPSRDDQQNMADLGNNYGKWHYLIVTKDDVAEYFTAVDWSRFT